MVRRPVARHCTGSPGGVGTAMDSDRSDLSSQLIAWLVWLVWLLAGGDRLRWPVLLLRALRRYALLSCSHVSIRYVRYDTVPL